MKRLTYILAFLIVILYPAVAYGTSNARLIIDYEEVLGLDVPPVMMNNRVMVPARSVFEHIGGTVEWNNVHRQISVRYNNDILVMTINETIAWLNGEVLIMDAPPVMINNNTMIPLRFPAEAFGFFVDWDIAARAAIILTNTNGSDDNAYNDNGYTESNTEETPDDHAHQPDGHTTSQPYEYEVDHENNHGHDLATDISHVPILAESHPVTNITALRTPSDTGAMAYVIVASSAISDVNHFLLPDNRLVMDIYNARTSISGPFHAYGPVREIGHSQFSRSPYTTRVVFHLTVATDFSISLSNDRRELTIEFNKNNIAFTPTVYVDRDILTISGDFQPSIRVSKTNYPLSLTIYVDNSTIRDTGERLSIGAFTSHYVVEQRHNGVAVIHVFMSGEWPAISIDQGRGYVTVVLHPGLHGTRYNFRSRELRLSRDVVAHMDITSIRRNNEYHQGRYTLTLPIPAYMLGWGSLYIADRYINTVSIRSNSTGNAEIVFETSRIMAFTIHETYDEIVIRARLPQDVYPFIIVIDPGHGGRDPGAVHHGLHESDIVLAISHMVAERLSHHPDIKVYMTRHTNVAVSLSQRTRFANRLPADLYISIHANAVRNRPHVSGIETWYLPHTREDNLRFNSRQLAQILQRHMISATGAYDRGVRNTSSFIVLRDTNMPATLLEVGFLSNAQEAARLATTAHQQLLAQAIYEGILEIFELYRQV